MSRLLRSNSVPLSRGFSIDNGRDPSVTLLDNNNIQIIISSNPIPILSRAQTPVAASPQDESTTRVNERSPQDLSYLKREVYGYALNNRWHEAESIFDDFPDMVRIPLTASGDTALHVAVSANSISFVEGLVNLMTPEDLQIPNSDGNTAFCMAAISGNGAFFQIMIDKNQNLPIIPGHDVMLPIHLAALTGHHTIVQHLSSQNLLHNVPSQDIQRLFFMTISSSMFDVATTLFEQYPADLAIARDDKEHLTALHMLARKHSEELYMEEENNEGASSRAGLQLLKKLWNQVRQLEYNQILELITQPSSVLLDSIKSGNVDTVKWLLYMNRELLTLKDFNNGWNLLHFSVLYRQRTIFHFLLKMRTVNLVLREVDNDRNNVLHFAAHQQDEPSSTLRPNIQMQRELVWFKEVERLVPRELRRMRNNWQNTKGHIL